MRGATQKFILLFLISFGLVHLSVFSAPSPTPRLLAIASKERVKPGEHFQIVLQFHNITKDDIAFKLPEFFKSLAIFQEGFRIPGRDAHPEVSFEYHIEAAYFSLPDLALTDITFDIINPKLIQMMGTRKLSAPPLTIQTELFAAGETELKPIKGPLRLSINWIAYLLLVLGILCTLAALFALISVVGKRLGRRRAARTPSTTPEVEPFVEAVRALEALRLRREAETASSREFYTKTSFVIKRLFQRLFQRPILEWTTSETIGYLSKTRDDPYGFSPQQTERLLFEADLAKFAKQDYTPPQHLDHLRQTEALVQGAEAVKRRQEIIEANRERQREQKKETGQHAL